MNETDFFSLCDAIAGKAVDRSNAMSVYRGLSDGDLQMPHRVAQYLAQVMHESAAFRYDREIASGAAYEGRADLGNTQPGDGKRYKGRGPIQLTGRYNYRKFTAWANDRDIAAPNFETDPDAVNTDPWEGLAAYWYWQAGNPTGKSLNVYADEGNIEAITRKINGGLNGYEDRCQYYARCALALLGYAIGQPGSGTEKTAIREFQRAAKLDADGIAGRNTRDALHKALKAMQAKPAPQPGTPSVEPSENFFPAGTYLAWVDRAGNLKVEN